jgi:hypothetical protein
VNSKQIVAAVSAVVLVAILVYPALSTGTVSIHLQSTSIEKADHVYVLVGNVWVHRAGQSGADGWELVSNQSQTVDLVSLESTTISLAKGQVRLGGYDTIRLDVSNVTWVFNKTTTRLSVQVSELQTNLEFITQAGRESTITLVLSGHTEDIRGTKFFVPNMNATLSGVPSSPQS